MKSKKGSSNSRKKKSTDPKKKRSASSPSGASPKAKSGGSMQAKSSGRSRSSQKKASRKGTLKSHLSELDFWKQNWIPALIVTVLAFPLYWAAIKFDYVLDDAIVLSENRFVEQGTAGIGDILGKDTFLGYKPYEGNEGAVVGSRYRPLSLITFAIETEIWGVDTEVLQAKFSGEELTAEIQGATEKKKRAHHFINILLYALSGLLLFRVLALVFPEKDKQKGKVPWLFGIAFVASILFMAHPLHVEAVANIKGRDEILALIFSLWTLYFSYRYVQSEKILPLVLSAVMFYLGILAKENSITFFAVIPLAIFLFTKTPIKKLLITMAPLAVVVFFYLIQRGAVIEHAFGGGKEVTELMNNPFVEMTFMEKYAAIFHTLFLYVKLLFVPHPLTHDYYPYQIPIGDWGRWQSILGLVIYAGMIGVAIWQWKKSKITLFPFYSIS